MRGQISGMDAQMSFTLSLFDSKTDALPKEARRTWAQMCGRFERPVVREAKDGPLFSPALFRPAYRLQENVSELSLLVLDYDHHAAFHDDLAPWRELGCCFGAYTTHSHRRVTKSNPEAEERFRVVVPLAVPIPVEKFPSLWQWAARLSSGKIDAQAQDASRMYYTPAVASPDAPYQFVTVEGELLDWRTFDLASPQESATPEGQSARGPDADEFASWDDLNAEAARRISTLPGARSGRKGWTTAPGVCHGRDKGKALYVSPGGAYGCHKGCEGAVIRLALGLPERPAGAAGEPEGKGKQDDSPLRVVRMADVVAERVTWLWHPYIALGKLTILEGDPGLGKSWLTCALACAVTRGRGLPSAEPFEPGVVLMLSAEDGLGDTLRPRLDAVGADVAQVFALAELLTFDEGGLLRLESAIIEHGPKLVIIDPLFAFTGGKVDIHRANECRAITSRLAAIAERHGCAIIAVRHLGKSRGGGHALNAGIGSIDLTAAARSVLLVGRDPDDEQKRAVVQTKNNLAPCGEAIGYKLEGGQFYWTGESDLTAGRILSVVSNEEERSARTEAVDFLRAALSGGEREIDDVKAEARRAGIADATLRRARERLGLKASRQGTPGTRQRFVWRLTIQDDAQVHADDAQKRGDEHHRANGSGNGSYDNGLADDDQGTVIEHQRADGCASSACVEPLSDEEAELAARLEYMEGLPRAEAERRARTWYGPVPF